LQRYCKTLYNLGDMECNWLHNLYIISSLLWNYQGCVCIDLVRFVGRFVDQLLLKKGGIWVCVHTLHYIISCNTMHGTQRVERISKEKGNSNPCPIAGFIQANKHDDCVTYEQTWVACYVICTWKRFWRFAVAVQSCLADTVVSQPSAARTRPANPSVRTACVIMSRLASSVT